MNINTRAVNIEITPALKDYAEKRFSNIDKYTPIASVDIDLEKSTNHHRSGEIFLVTVKVITVLGKVIISKSEKTDMYEAIDEARSDVARALNEGKKKRDSIFRRGAKKIKNMIKGISGKRGFTLVEIIVIIGITVLVLGIIIASINSARSKSRDTARVTDMRKVVLALEDYYTKYGRYPDGDGLGPGGWDTPESGGFIKVLNDEGFLKEEIKDPQSINANYRYYRYGAGAYGCQAAAFYVLQIINLENVAAGQKHKDSESWQCPNRNWNTEAEWIVGRYE